MIVVTGAAGFIGSCMISHLNKVGYNNIIAVDDFTREDKNKNLEGKDLALRIGRDIFFDQVSGLSGKPDFVIHLGARTDTAEFDHRVFDRLNLGYSKRMWEFCASKRIPLIYASSAATYGMGEHGYRDDHQLVDQLRPLNPYGESKNEFDKWVLRQDKKPPFWAGLKFFNVYGPNEYHKGRMASVIYHAFHQISNTGGLNLFRSHHPNYQDGQQQRDFIYVKDLTRIMLWLMEKTPESALYNTGSGRARTFLDLGKAVFDAMKTPHNIRFIDTPRDIRDKYQYYTRAPMEKLKNQGYTHEFATLEEGVRDYVSHYLAKGKFY